MFAGISFVLTGPLTTNILYLIISIFTNLTSIDGKPGLITTNHTRFDANGGTITKN